MARERFGARLMEQLESPGAGAGAGSARLGGCTGIGLGEAGTGTARGPLESAKLVRMESVGPPGGRLLGAGRGYAVTCKSKVKAWSMEVYRWDRWTVP